MKVFFDTEFTGLHKGSTLISIGLIAENGREFYAEFCDYDNKQVDEWLQENVINNLKFKNCENFINSNNIDFITMKGTKHDVGMALSDWFAGFNNVEMWTDCGAYDWVLFCDIFNHAFNIPNNIYYIWYDICTLMNVKGINSDISREGFIKNSIYGDKHNSMYDARVIKACYEKLVNKGEINEKTIKQERLK